MISRFSLTAGALLLAAVALTGFACKMSSPTAPTTPVAAADVTINIAGMNDALSFSPNPGTIPVGKTVSWHNVDSTTHNVNANDGSFSTGNIAPGATSTPIKMSAVGSFAYHCSIHPTMVGSVNVQ